MSVIVLMTVLSSCTVFKGAEVPLYSFDPVCGMKVSEADAFTWKYKGTVYYFDTYNCKESFRMNPEKFLNANKCVAQTAAAQTK